MPSKHAVVGGLGNLGRHVQKMLVQEGRSVRVIDRPPANSSALPTMLAHSSAVEFIPFTLGQGKSFADADASTTVPHSDELTKALRGVETVYSVVTPDVQHGTIGDFERTNVKGMQQLIQSCRAAGVSKLVFASSISVTNHYVDSIDDNEDTVLPSIDSYQSHYDRTKRMGEDLVLKANNDGDLKTCALRIGGVMAGPNDYMFRENFRVAQKTGKIYSIAGAKPIDSIAASDVALAMRQADIKLSDSDSSLPGSALFVTKDKSNVSPPPSEVSEYMAECMGFKFQLLPEFATKIIGGFHEMQYNIFTKRMTRNPKDLPGVPPHMWIDIVRYVKSFDNAKARQVLDYQPQVTWKEAVEAISEEYRNSQRAL